MLYLLKLITERKRNMQNLKLFNRKMPVDINEKNTIPKLYHFNSKRNYRTMLKSCDVFASALIRCILIAEIIFTIYFLSVLSKKFYFCILILAIVILLIDGTFIILKRNGKEYSWQVNEFFSKLLI